MKLFKYFAITLLSIVGLLCLAVLIAITVFKDELVEYISHSQQEQIKAYYISDIPVEAENFAEDFESIHQQVVESCSLCEQKGYDIDSLYHSFARRIEDQVRTKSDYGLLISEYFAALNIGHAGAHFNAHAAEYHPVIAEDRLFVIDPNEHLATFGFRDNDEIIAINNIPVEQYVADRSKYTSASTEPYRLHRARVGVFVSLTDTLITCQVSRDGELLTLDLPLNAARSANNDPSLCAKVIADNVGYINISTMMDNVVEEFESAYQNLCDLPFLIVDVRNNGGGNSNNGRLIAEYLLCRGQEHCVGGTITPRPNAYRGKLFLLVSPYTFSAAESFALDLKESSLATLVGETTAGDTGCNPQNFKSRYGICFRIPIREPHTSPKGFPMEGAGIEPHYTVKQSVEDLFEGKDTVIEYVLDELISQNSN